MLRTQNGAKDHNWGQSSVIDLIKSIYLNMKMYRLGICPMLLKDMSDSDYRVYARIVENLLNKSA